MLDFDTVQKVVLMSSQSSLASLEIKGSTGRILVVNAPKSTPTHQGSSQVVAKGNTNTMDTVQTIASPAVGHLCLDGITIKSGDTVQSGDTIASILALGVLSPVIADKTGVFVKYLQQEGDPVQWGQNIAVIDCTT